jgi:hypothetical protein
LFLKLLRELIKLQVGAGPVVGNLRVPDIMYANDAALTSQSAAGAQQLLMCWMCSASSLVWR